jgi:hypothetical protein
MVSNVICNGNLNYELEKYNRSFSITGIHPLDKTKFIKCVSNEKRLTKGNNYKWIRLTSYPDKITVICDDGIEGKFDTRLFCTFINCNNYNTRHGSRCEKW